MVLVDSDILIQYSRSDDDAAAWLDRTSAHSKLAISAVTDMELTIGSRDKIHLREVKRFIAQFEIIHIDEDISRQASELIERYCLSNRLQLPDALIAATALINGLDLGTINKKDFRFIEGLRLVDYP